MATHCSDEEGGSWYINSHGASILKKKRESLHFARNKSKKQMEKVAERHIDRQILSNQITQIIVLFWLLDYSLTITCVMLSMT